MKTDRINIFFQEELFSLEQRGLRRALKSVEGPQDREIIVDGKKVLNFCSNNYLGLANHPSLRSVAVHSLETEGLGSGASRLVCGNMQAHQDLENRLAKFKGTEKCLVFGSGYMANVGIISSLFGRDDIIFSDRLNHASIIDGIILSGAKFKRYPHKDMDTLRSWLKESGQFKKRLIVTDTVFSMDGDVAPLDRIVKLAREFDAMVMIDEAHGFGVLGKTGKGAAEYFGVEESIDIQMGTLSKAAGVFGAYCCGSNELISYLINHARSFIYTTAIPPSLARAGIEAVNIIEHQPELRDELWRKTSSLILQLKEMGWNTLETRTPIIPLVVHDSQKAVEFSRRLFESGIFVSAIRPPTVPINTARLRLTVMASHTDQDISFLLEKLRMIGRELCLL